MRLWLEQIRVSDGCEDNRDGRLVFSDDGGVRRGKAIFLASCFSSLVGRVKILYFFIIKVELLSDVQDLV